MISQTAYGSPCIQSTRTQTFGANKLSQILANNNDIEATACKVPKHGFFSDLYFPAFELNTERYNMEFFLVRIFPYLDGIRGDTEYFSVFSPNVRKYGPEKTPYFDTFHTVVIQNTRKYSSELKQNL